METVASWHGEVNYKRYQSLGVVGRSVGLGSTDSQLPLRADPRARATVPSLSFPLHSLSLPLPRHSISLAFSLSLLTLSLSFPFTLSFALIPLHPTLSVLYTTILLPFLPFVDPPSSHQ